MLFARPQRLSWQLTCALFAVVATADITPSNETTVGSNRFQGTLTLQDAQRNNLSELVPLTREAATRSIEGNLFNTNYQSVGNISDGEIAYLSCDREDYTGFIDAQSVFVQAHDNGNITGVILYSKTSNYCAYQQEASQDQIQDFPVLSMTNKEDSKKVLDAIDDLAVPLKFFVNVAGSGSNGDNDGPTQQQQNPLGPSPSTAVAMIILYSITGIITALFLVIIITGAVRAHRHPDRYGPRDVLGRPRQSRARGLGRAILDTIPIVKFGEREPPKPTDVELGSTPETRDVNNGTAENEAQNHHTLSETETQTANATETPRDVNLTDQPSGIAPAVAAGAIPTSENRSNDEGLGCSICTDDFEKGQDIRVLPCNHKFHPDCVDPWLLNVSGTCPLCRVDLRPVTSRTSADEEDPEHLAPPLQPETDVSHRRRSALRDILSLRHRPNASAEERISALRRLRELRHNQSGEVTTGSANNSSEDVTSNRDRRSKRMSVRLSDVFGGRTRRGARDDSPPPGESSSSGTQQPSRRDQSPGPNSNIDNTPDSNSYPNQRP